MREAYKIGSYIAQQKITFDAIFSSTAKRALGTTEIVCDAMKVSTSLIIHVDDLYEASVRTFFDYVTKIDDQLKTIMCVAHNPTVSYLAEYLTKAHIPSMETGGLAIISFDVRSWREVSEGNGSLSAYITPSTVSDGD